MLPTQTPELISEVPLPVDTAAKGPIETSLHAIRFTIQVGAFSAIARAARYADRMQATGLDAYYFIDEDGLSKVRFDKFDTKAAARQRGLELQARGVIDGFYVVQPHIGEKPADGAKTLPIRLVQTARRFIGAPYRWGGTSQTDGFDCSGLTMTVYRLNGLELPRSARNQFLVGRSISRQELAAGDLVFFDTAGSGRITHVGIYSGKHQFIHAPGRGKSIRKASLSSEFFSSRYIGARRYR